MKLPSWLWLFMIGLYNNKGWSVKTDVKEFLVSWVKNYYLDLVIKTDAILKSAAYTQIDIITSQLLLSLFSWRHIRQSSN